VLDPGQIAGLYRALRKGREDAKNEPGAADFYYGEMEMCRARPVSSGNPDDQSGAASPGWEEIGILTAYRLWRPAARPGDAAADFRNSPLSITGIPQGTSGAEGLG
jgi:hypothetical protein